MSDEGFEGRRALPDLQEWRAIVQHFEGRGSVLRAYDATVRAREHYPDDLWLKHRAVLALARSGATDMATRRYHEFALDKERDEDAAALGARLAKDRVWLAEAEQRRRRAAAAADAYGRVYDNTGGYFPGINATTMWLIADEPERARALAGRILDDLARMPAADGEEGYYREATAAEALLILGDVNGAADALRRATTAHDSDMAARATTRRQLRRVCQALGLGTELLETLAAPRVIHYCGHMISRSEQPGRFAAEDEGRIAADIRRHLDATGVGFAYGSLACGADILFAEALYDRGAETNVVLPFRSREFVDVSVHPGGEGWSDRFQRCLGRAASVSFATEDSYLGDDQLFAYASRLAMGLALLRARHMDTSVEQVAVWDGAAPGGAAGTAVDVELWRGYGFPQTIIDSPATTGSGSFVQGPRPTAPGGASERIVGRVNRALLFGDITGFSRLDDRQLPVFIRDVLGAMAGVLSRYEDPLLFRNTWGDGIYLVFDDVHQAARCAMDLQIAMSGLPLESLGLPENLGLRLGGHFGPVHESDDPIIGTVNFFGAHVNRAARIEPITPEGCVYVSEPFAAAIALDPTHEFDCDYVGTIPTAKEYGDLSMYLLRKRSG